MSPATLNTHAFFFFFQAEDGIRDTSVTGVQTCALPIYRRRSRRRARPQSRADRARPLDRLLLRRPARSRAAGAAPRGVMERAASGGASRAGGAGDRADPSAPLAARARAGVPARAQAARRVRGARGAGWLGAPPPPRKPPRPLTSRARRPGEAAAGALQRRAAPARPLRRSLVAPAAHADRGAARGGGRDRRHAPRRARADPRGHGFGQDARLP